MSRVAIFGGSFDPIHMGHAMIANYVSQSGLVDEVWLMPGRINPLKQQGRKPAKPADRLEMCRFVADKCINVKVCDIELDMPEPSYTSDTLARLSCDFPQHTFSLLIGSDNWRIFDRWHNSDDIIRNHKILVFVRIGEEIDKTSLPPNVTLIENTPTAQISSTFIRNELNNGKNMTYFLPADVLNYIQSNHLYNV